ncbi:MAG: cupredoxin domain-containing protein, partial [Chloroflexi bacterium]|nr:cupredoxin domain-containing protein [Chloroflexota bacterium]
RYSAGTPQPQPAEVKINIKDFEFSPSVVTVAVGTKVTWTEVGPTEHNTVSKDRLWDSGIMAIGQTFSYTFTKTGVYNYWCTIHSEMLGQVTVR